MKSVVVNPRSYDWEGDTPPNRPSSRTIVYGDVTSPAMMDALAISRACAVIVTTRDYSAVKRLTGNLLHFYPGVKVMVARDRSSAGGRPHAGGDVELWEIGLGRAWRRT